ncbi:YvrJ family protein [Salibacterium lacus]|uniref:YvrJ family protein n=1 Tax=Salibacterium lacus TaxID=1898109 RepID=A0ABW5T5I5_9BACI
MDMWLNAVGEYGISTVIAFYLLHRMEKKLDTLIYVVQAREQADTAAVRPVTLESHEKTTPLQ